MSIDNYSYQNESTIDPNLICNKCSKPFIDPVSLPLPCEETYCRICITSDLQNHLDNCQYCNNKSLTNEDLRPHGTITKKILNELPVQCNLCNQDNIHRHQFPKHIQESCPKRNVFCKAKDIKCPWNGPYDQLDQHLNQCPYEQIRPLLIELINENKRLDELDQLKQELQDLTDKFKNEQSINQQISNENKNLKDQLTQMENIQNENESIKKSLEEHLSEINKLKEENKSIQLLKNKIDQLEKLNQDYQKDISIIQQIAEQNKYLKDNLQKFILRENDHQNILQQYQKQQIIIKDLLNEKNHLKQISNHIKKQIRLLKPKLKHKSNLSKYLNKRNKFIKQQYRLYRLQIEQQSISNQQQIDQQTTEHQIQIEKLHNNYQRTIDQQSNNYQSQIDQLSLKYQLQIQEMSAQYQQEFDQLNIHIEKLNNKLYQPNIISKNCIRENDYRNKELEEMIDLCEINSLLNLNGLKLNHDDIEIVLNKGLITKQCESLILWNNCLLTDSILKLSSILNLNKSLRKLSIVKNDLNDHSIEYLCSSLTLSNCTLKELILGSNKITDRGLMYLSDMLKINETLIVLGLQDNKITNRGIEYLSKIKNDFIEQISLYSNRLITDHSINYITNIIQNNKSLNQFWIWDCQLSKQGMNQLIQSIQTKINFQLLL